MQAIDMVRDRRRDELLCSIQVRRLEEILREGALLVGAIQALQSYSGELSYTVHENLGKQKK